MQVYRSSKRRGPSTPVRAIFLIVALAALALALAFLWHTYQDTPSTSAEPSGGEPASEESSAVSESPAVVPAPPASADGFGEDPDGGEGVYQPTAVAGAVPQREKVDNSYFDDAIFFGDSLSTGIPLYKVAGSPDTVAYAGINPLTINSSAVISTVDGDRTMLVAAEELYGEKNKVYIMLGSNGLWLDEDSFAEGYRTFVESVKTQYPGAVIYLQSIPPVTGSAHENYEGADNDTIDSLNERILALSQETGTYYLDIASAMKGPDGALPDEASPLDGIHFTPEYYYIWFDYLKTHTVEVR